MIFWDVLFDIVCVLGGAIAVGGLFTRFGQSPILGYLLAGMLLGGPGSLQIVGSKEAIDFIAELGVSLLLFSLGLEFSLKRMKALGWRLLLAAALQVTVTLLAVALIAMSFGFSLGEGIVIGSMVSLSSTACVLRVLVDRSEMDSAHGRNSLAILLIQDIAVVVLAVIISAMASGGEQSDTLSQMGWILGSALILIAALYVLVNYVLVFALGVFTIERNRELSVLLAVTVGLASMYSAHAVGISPALGAFVSGMFLGSSPFATQVRADISSFRVVLLTLFFGAAGMVADPIWIASHWHLVIPTTVGLIVGKAVIIWCLLAAFGQVTSVAIATGLSVSQVGEFAFVLGGIGVSNGALSSDAHLLIVSCAIISLFLTPYLIAYAPRIGLSVAQMFGVSSNDEGAPKAQGRVAPEVVVVGFGPSGQAAAADLQRFGERLLVIDLNKTTRSRVREFGFRFEVGDAADIDVLAHAQIEHTRVVIITIPNKSAALLALKNVRKLAAKAFVIVRARYEQDTRDLELAGANKVVCDEEHVGHGLAREVTEILPGNT